MTSSTPEITGIENCWYMYFLFFQGTTKEGPFEYETTIDMSHTSSTITIDNLDEESRYKVTFSPLLYEGTKKL